MYYRVLLYLVSGPVNDRQHVLSNIPLDYSLYRTEAIKLPLAPIGR